MKDIDRIPGKSENDDMMIRFHHCLQAVLEKHRDLMGEDEQEYENAVLQSLAKGCCEIGCLWSSPCEGRGSPRCCIMTGTR